MISAESRTAAGISIPVGLTYEEFLEWLWLWTLPKMPDIFRAWGLM
jgi:hypothetical protein